MEKKDLDIETIKRYWVTEAEEGLNVAGHLFEKGDYSYALFFGHLAIEKLLKGLYVERKHNTPLVSITYLDLRGWLASNWMKRKRTVWLSFPRSISRRGIQI